jgi:hypothetical protein
MNKEIIYTEVNFCPKCGHGKFDIFDFQQYSLNGYNPVYNISMSIESDRRERPPSCTEECYNYNNCSTGVADYVLAIQCKQCNYLFYVSVGVDDKFVWSCEFRLTNREELTIKEILE